MILEGIVTTCAADGTTNVAPMGPKIDPAWQRLRLRPFRTSTTYANLRSDGRGVLHVTDDVWLFAQAAIKRWQEPPPLERCPTFDVMMLADACRWYAFEVEHLDDSHDRTEIDVRIVDHGVKRAFFGFNRAKHAVIEAAILATRIHLLGPEAVGEEFARLASLVEKTGGPQERAAWALLQDYLNESRSNVDDRPAI